MSAATKIPERPYRLAMGKDKGRWSYFLHLGKKQKRIHSKRTFRTESEAREAMTAHRREQDKTLKRSVSVIADLRKKKKRMPSELRAR